MDVLNRHRHISLTKILFGKQTSCMRQVAITVEPRFNEPLFNEVLDITNDTLRPGQSYSKMCRIEPRFNEPLFNEVLDITNDTLRPGQSYSKMYGIEPRYNELR